MHYSTVKNPRVRTATIDFGRVSNRRHTIAGMIEIDITVARENLRKARKKEKISFHGWVITKISEVLAEHKQVAAYVKRKKILYLFDDVSMSVVLEKEKEGIRVPIPLMIQHSNRMNAAEITEVIEQARQKKLPKNEVIFHQYMTFLMRIYYYLPPFMRRWIWVFMIKRPKLAYGRMGNCVVTAVGNLGKVNGWFLHSTLHPVSFGIGAVTRKPWVVCNEIMIREILHMTILFDHDVVDGGEMARFVGKLVSVMEKGEV